MLADGFSLTESPRWHKGRLYSYRLLLRHLWAPCARALDEAGRVETIMSFDDKPSGLGFLPDGDMLIVLMDSAKLMRLGRSGLTLTLTSAVLRTAKSTTWRWRRPGVPMSDSWALEVMVKRMDRADGPGDWVGLGGEREDSRHPICGVRTVSS